jgi:pimeloyl-ACP methyl ester carboxylesterase
VSFIATNGIRTHYQLTPATNPPHSPPPKVVFIHGLGYDSMASFYLTLAPSLSAAGIDVLGYDLRAHGRSDRPSRGYLLRDFTTDLRELLDGTRITEPVHLVGNSFGGTLAFAFAALHPERVRSIVAIESEPPTVAWSEKIQDTINGIVDVAEVDRHLALIEEHFGPHAVRLTQKAATNIRATSIAEDVPKGPLLRETDLAALTCPVLSIMGGDGFHREDLHILDRLLPHCTTEIVPEQNHSVLVDRHREIRPLVLDWITRHHRSAVLASEPGTTASLANATPSTAEAGG